jgi:small-conductance mechanosensitive channel
MQTIGEIFGTQIGETGITYGDLFWLIVILAVAIIIARVVTANMRRALEEKIPKNDLEILLKIIYFGILILGVMVALPNVDLSGVLIAGGIVGLVIGFASQSVVANFISGLFLIIERPVKIGDNVNVGEISGNVDDIHILSTIVKTYDGVYVRIPNEKVFTSNITNYWSNPARRFEYVVGIRYADDAEKAIHIIRQQIWEHPFALKSPAPSVYVDELGDNGVNIMVRIWAPSHVWWDVRTHLLWKIKVALEAEGIEIPFPQRTLWFSEPLRAEIARENKDGMTPPAGEDLR